MLVMFYLQRLELVTPRPSSSAVPTKSGAGPCASQRSGSVTEIQIVLMAQMKTGKLERFIKRKKVTVLMFYFCNFYLLKN